MGNSKVLIRRTFFAGWKMKTVAAVLAVAAAVALPQLLHAVGAVSGLGAALGGAFLPMHLAIFLVGLLAGPVAGVAAGMLSPCVSYLLSGMPAATVLPFMVIELAGYGLVSGLLASSRMHVFFKLLIAQVLGRAIRAAVVLISFYGFNAGLPASSIWAGIVAGLPGILLQWVLITLIMFRIEHKKQAGE